MGRIVYGVALGLCLLSAAALLTGCAPMKCQVLGDIQTRREVEVCERRVCRDMATHQFISCPGAR